MIQVAIYYTISTDQDQYLCITAPIHYLVVTQYYEADVNKEHVIRGNSAVMKCLIPSFVADFVEVVSWHTDENDTYYARTDMGSSSGY